MNTFQSFHVHENIFGDFILHEVPLHVNGAFKVAKMYFYATMQLNPRQKTLTIRRRHICNSDASNLRVAEAQQEGPIGSVLEDEVQMLLSDEAKYQPGGSNIRGTRSARGERQGASRPGGCLTLRSSSSSDASS